MRDKSDSKIAILQKELSNGEKLASYDDEDDLIQ